MRSFFFIGLIFLFGSCSENSSGPDFYLSENEITYEVSGGWINPHTLKVYSDAMARAFFYDDTLGSFVLSENEIEGLEEDMADFSSFKKYYAPDDFYTDQNTHTIIAHYKSGNDTVSVYMPDQAPVPVKLRSLLKRLDAIYEKAIGLGDEG